MTDNKDLIAEAFAHIDKAADAAPLSARPAILRGNVADQRMSLIARLARTLDSATSESDALSADLEQAMDALERLHLLVEHAKAIAVDVKLGATDQIDELLKLLKEPPSPSALDHAKAEAFAEGWALRASRGYAHLKVGESVPLPDHINPYRRKRADA